MQVRGKKKLACSKSSVLNNASLEGSLLVKCRSCPTTVSHKISKTIRFGYFRGPLCTKHPESNGYNSSISPTEYLDRLPLAWRINHHKIKTNHPWLCMNSYSSCDFRATFTFDDTNRPHFIEPYENVTSRTMNREMDERQPILSRSTWKVATFRGQAPSFSFFLSLLSPLFLQTNGTV